MSLEAITWAFRQSLTPSEKLVLLTLADYADDENKCWPKQETLATRTGLKRPTIALKMKSLESAGLLTRTKRQYTSDITFLNIDVTTITNEKTKQKTRTTRTTRAFQPPTLAEVTAYAKTIKAESQAAKFHEYFTVGNWKDSRGVAVRNWKQKLLTWKSFNEKRGKDSSRNNGTFAGASDYGAAAINAGGS